MRIFEMFTFGIFWATGPQDDTKSKIGPWLEDCYKTKQDLVLDDLYYNREMYKEETQTNNMTDQIDLRDTIKKKAEKHSRYYRSLYMRTDNGTNTSSEMAPPATLRPLNTIQTTLRAEFEEHKKQDKSKQRRIGVCEINENRKPDEKFKSVKVLRENYQQMIEKMKKNVKEEKLNTVRKDMYLIPPASEYYSSSASAGSDDEKERIWYTTKKRHAEVRRCGSSDSAVGLTQSDDEVSSNVNAEITDNINLQWADTCEKKYATLHSQYYSPYSPRGSIDHINVPTKTLVEAQYFSLPLNRKYSDCPSDIECEKNESRRQSCFTDDGDEQSRYRFWRTPSVVVSDYSDDVIGLSLEDIEYLRNQRRENSSPDSSLHSSCSNLNYCGSTISSLETEYIFKKPFRNGSDCSSCSTFSGDEGDSDEKQPQTSIDKPSGWRKLRNIVQWTPFFQTYKKQRYPWVQLAGHQGNFKAGPDQGTILKKLCTKEEKCFKILMKDVLRPYVPEFRGVVGSDDGECEYLQLQDLLSDFISPCVMDCKIGVRTYLEEELAKAKEKPKLRKDMYEKMCQIDKSAPTDEEHRLKGVTKPRYMVWRETISSTATLGFRIEGIRRSDGTSSKDFKTTKTKEQIIKAFKDFSDGFPHAVPKYIQRLKAIKATLDSSTFFSTHEMIGSSLLFVHDRFNANVWLIDFAKTVALPENIRIDHNSKWIVGNHEDGYLIGLNNLISIFVTMLEQQPVAVTPPPLITQDTAEDEVGREEL